MLYRPLRKRKGQGLVEYALLVGGIALIGATAVSLIGHKTSDILGLVAVVLPGAHFGDNAPIESGHLIDTNTVGTNGSIAIDTAAILSQNGQDRLGNAVFGPQSVAAGNGVGGLIIESQ